LKTFNQMLSNQNGCCTICNRHYSEFKTGLHVDHDHKTKKVRALLCTSCNQGLGRFREIPELLENAAAYLRQFNEVSDG
jgi:hypothetical protein